MEMVDFGYYFRGIGQDIDALINPPAAGYSNLDSRIMSLAARVLGGIMALNGTVALVSNVVEFGINPTLGLVGIIISIARLIIAHDLIVIGDNMRLMHNADTTADGGLLSVMQLPRAVVDKTVATAYELSNGVSYIYRNTIVAERWAKFVVSC